MLMIEYTTQFKRDLKRIKKRKKNLHVIHDIIQLIQSEKIIPAKFRDHPLIGNWHHHRELHLEPDWLLIYKYELARNTVIFVRTRTHSDLFK